MDIGPVEKLKITLGGVAQVFLLIEANGFNGVSENDTGASTYLDKNEDILITADQVDFTPRRAIIAVKNAIAISAKKGCRHPLTVVPDLLSR